jgi:recombination DNA repair RAD52 pathway protein
MTEAIVITESDLSKVEDSVFNASQLQQILTKTPERYKKKRPGKGGQTWEYVEVGYVQKVLNLMFGFNWDFEIVDEKIIHGEVVVRGRLTVRSGDKQVVKTQYGNKILFASAGLKHPYQSATI